MLRCRQALDDLDVPRARAIAAERVSCPARGTGRSAYERVHPLLLHLAQWLPSRAGREIPPELAARLRSLGASESREVLDASVARVIEEAVHIAGGAATDMHPLVRQVLEVMRCSFREPLSLKTLAARFGVTPSYLGQILRAHTGRFFHEILAEARMREARNLLLGTDLKVALIAERVGIPQQSYFNRVFR